MEENRRPLDAAQVNKPSRSKAPYGHKVHHGRARGLAARI